MSVRPVRKAYEQVADQLRDLIIRGELSRDARLPNETTLAKDFGVSRATIREALRILTAQHLIRTGKGAGGGSYVTLPTVDYLSDFMSTSIGVLTEAQDVSLEEFLDARDLLEGAAARWAATRRSDDQLAAMRAAIPARPLEIDTATEFSHNHAFHSSVVEACGNVLIQLAVQPVFSVLQRNLERSVLPNEDRESVNHDHRDILDAIEARDPDAAEAAMRAHVASLRPVYERIWVHARVPAHLSLVNAQDGSTA